MDIWLNDQGVRVLGSLTQKAMARRTMTRCL
jgi:hypothetical protein